MRNPILNSEVESSPETPKVKSKPSSEFPIYNDAVDNEYDHISHAKILKNTLKETTNLKEEKNNTGGGIKRGLFKVSYRLVQGKFVYIVS